jgi:hypothetical protein
MSGESLNPSAWDDEQLIDRPARVLDSALAENQVEDPTMTTTESEPMPQTSGSTWTTAASPLERSATRAAEPTTTYTVVQVFPAPLPPIPESLKQRAAKEFWQSDTSK